MSCGWLAYNEKTIQIEDKIIGPACSQIIYRHVLGVDYPTSQMVASETLVDEAYYVLLVVNATRITRERRRLESLLLPEFALVTNMQREQGNHPEP